MTAQFSYLAVRLMQGNLSPTNFLNTAEDTGKSVLRVSQECIDITYNIGKKRSPFTCINRGNQKSPDRMSHLQKKRLHNKQNDKRIGTTLSGKRKTEIVTEIKPLHDLEFHLRIVLDREYPAF